MAKPKNKAAAVTKPKIKRNDQVVVLAGRDRGVRGKVLRVHPATGTAIVEGVNMVKKHTRPNPQRQIQGGVERRPVTSCGQKYLPMFIPKLILTVWLVLGMNFSGLMLMKKQRLFRSM